jgi:hypothetical protein
MRPPNADSSGRRTRTARTDSTSATSADIRADINNTRKIAAVVRDGRYLPRAELNTMLSSLAARYQSMPEPYRPAGASTQ